MLYFGYQALSDAWEPVRAAARGLLAIDAMMPPWLSGLLPAHQAAAVIEMMARGGLSHERPAFDIGAVTVGDRTVPVVEEAADATPFCTLRHFRKDIETIQPRVLVVAPLSGHFATLLRGTVATLLVDHDVYLTDWHNARDVAVADGRFGFEDCVDHIIRFLGAIGPGGHVVAVCQPAVPVLAAVAVMAAAGHPAQPRSMTLMAGPIDPRVNPTKVNQLACGRPLRWFERHVIATVPWQHRGAGRQVYPGFLQLAAFMAMNPGRHLKAHLDLQHHLARGDDANAAPIRAFYDEYFAVLDLTAEFYLETVQWVFQEARLAAGVLTHRGRRVEPGAIRRTALLTVEGERDDVCAVGQTVAAHELCTGLRPYLKRHHLQPGVGHYGVFSGRRWETQVYPIVRNLMLATD